MRVDLLSPKVVNEITRGGECHGAGRIWRPRFKLLCPLGKRGVAQAHFADHVATGLNWVHCVEKVRARPESTAREERAHLVRAERVEVRTCIWNVHGHVRHRLTAVHGEQSASRVNLRCDLRERRSRAEHVGDVADRHDLRSQLQQAFESVPENFAGDIINGDELKVGVDFARHLLPRDQVRVMLRLRDEHHIAARKVGAPPRTCDKVQRLCCTPKHHQLFGGNAEECSGASARTFIRSGCISTERVRTAMWVGVCCQQEVRDGVHHGLRSLRSCGGIQVVQWSAAWRCGEDRICGAHLQRVKLTPWGVPVAHAPAGATGGAAASSAVGLIPFSARIGA